ncbi:MAG: hypothetical protein AAF383_14545 [Cyanobacteria bacterium P01_A01_bin.83]
MDFSDISTEPAIFDSADASLIPDSSDSSDSWTEDTAASPLTADIEPTETSNMVFSTSDVINEPILTDSSPSDVTLTANTADTDFITGAAPATLDAAGSQLVDGLFTVDELLNNVGFPTRTPDLIAVGNFRPGTPTDDGNPRTFVDYTFDESAELSGGDGTNFNLVPVDGGPVIDAQELISGDGTNVYTIAYIGTIEQTDIARGFVDSGTVSRPNRNPTNPLASADVSNGGNTSDPDLVSVVPDITTNELIYTFDQEVNIDDDAGFGFYRRNGREFDGSVARQLTPTTVAVEFVDVDVSSAVGATVDNGAVADLQDDSNQPDEVLVGTLI